MPRRIFIMAAVFVVGMIAGAAALYFFAPSLLTEEERTPPGSNQTLLARAYMAADLIKSANYKELADLVSPEKGVLFVPYTTVLTDQHRKFTAKEVAGFSEDKTKYVWGNQEGSGEPIKITASEYFSRYVYNRDYIEATNIGINTAMKTGNSLDNSSEVFPDGQFVEFHFSGFDPQYEGLDWCSLRLVFEEENNSLQLVAIIHGEWTP